MRVTFKLNPVSITPNLLEPIHAVRNPDWVRPPTREEMTKAYPPQALGASGSAILDCIVEVDGLLDKCSVQEKPAGLGFGEAALKISKVMRMQPQLYDGEPRGGASVRLPLIWRGR
jgi:periplasmic protein TonB